MSSTHKDRVNSFFGYGYTLSLYGAECATILPTVGTIAGAVIAGVSSGDNDDNGLLVL